MYIYTHTHNAVARVHLFIHIFTLQALLAQKDEALAEIGKMKTVIHPMPPCLPELRRNKKRLGVFVTLQWWASTTLFLESLQLLSIYYLIVPLIH
jgi:hypothetical protein